MQEMQKDIQDIRKTFRSMPKVQEKRYEDMSKKELIKQIHYIKGFYTGKLTNKEVMIRAMLRQLKYVREKLDYFLKHPFARDMTQNRRKR